VKTPASWLSSLFQWAKDYVQNWRLQRERSKSQFEKVLEILNVEAIYAYSPQAKGRAGRIFRTFQDRLTL